MIRFLQVGSDAVLVELDDLEAAIELFESLDKAEVPGVLELIPAARTMLIRFSPYELSTGQVVKFVKQIRANQAGLSSEASGVTVEIPVRYDGEDLDEVADHLKIEPAEVIRRHTCAEYTVAFTGFAPGFAYLAAAEALLDVPRKSSPRVRIPPGAVALAGRFSGVYPRASPGGWQLIGTTSQQMWDLDAERPALLQPGDRVRFVEVTAEESARQDAESIEVRGNDAQPAAASGQSSSGSQQEHGLEITAAGMQTLLQDMGRPGQSRLGLSRSGAMDPPALRAANRLVGNRSDTAGLEVAMGGLVVTARGHQVIAVTGADIRLTVMRPSGAKYEPRTNQAFGLDDGDILTLGHVESGVRSYLAIRGAVELPTVLGSHATDTMSGIGPGPLAPGDFLPIRQLLGGGAAAAHPVDPSIELPKPGEVVVIDVLPGPRADWFSSVGLAALFDQEWSVTPQSNRVGLRLKADRPMERSTDEELPSEATVIGAIQVPADGQPVLFLADHPVTGGYPVAAVVAAHHLALAAQLPVGARVRFRSVSEGLGVLDVHFDDSDT